MFDLKWLITSDENVQTNLVLLPAGLVSMPWAIIDHMLMNWMVTLLSTTGNVIMHDVPNFSFSSQLPFHKIRAFTVVR